MYNLRRNRRERDRRQNGERLTSGHSLQNPCRWFVHIFAFTTGFLLCVSHLFFLGISLSDTYGTARMCPLLISGSFFGVLHLTNKIRRRRRQEQQQDQRRPEMLDPNAGLAEYEIPPAPKEPEQQAPYTPNRRRRSRRR